MQFAVLAALENGLIYKRNEAKSLKNSCAISVLGDFGNWKKK